MLQDAPFDPDSVRYMRIGGKPTDNNKSRPVKLPLNDPEDARWVVQQYLASLMEKLEERKGQDVNNLALKYVGGIPLIVQRDINSDGTSQPIEKASTSSQRQSASGSTNKEKINETSNEKQHGAKTRRVTFKLK
ncbi:hypothetical protein QAD02_020879 [Eretmocerus hayati]|uniref:Uncharacterized protein n=1 Tax=Eretmocerus hayati TaxID=131215 RepID=A0ACC2PNL0_9HYME|nr:hypothetical protein QAD02_020879 [Eretmocerus hayati]